MSLVIRLRREGTKDRPFYRIVATNSGGPRDGGFLEILGTYDPMQAKGNTNVHTDKMNAWLAKGAKPSPTVASILKRTATAAAK